MISVSNTVGRLAEIRMTPPITSEDLAGMQRDMTVVLGRVPGRIVVCADMSASSVLPSEIADRLARFFRASNARLERTAIVVGGGATFFLQVERLLREGGSSRGESPSSRDPGSARNAPASDPTSPRRQPDRSSDPLMSKRLSERRAFRTTAEASTWLDEILTTEERSRLRAFLAGPRT